MTTVLRVVFASLAVAFAVSAAPLEDMVTSLPDFNETLVGHYSGYLNGTEGARLHYYVASASDIAPATAPTVFWLNGGPGCSSMDGWGYELGPFHFKNFGTAGPTFQRNPHTWARRANVVFLEAPPGVGFSYRLDGNVTISDSGNARDNYAAVLDFFAHKFPEWRQNKLFIAGESYGGIYVPTLASAIYNGGVLTDIFSGMLVGNGVTDDNYDNLQFGDLPFYYGHGFISSEVFHTVNDCLNASGGGSGSGSFSAPCNDAINKMYNDVQYLNFYGAYLYCFSPPQMYSLHLPGHRRRLDHGAKQRGISTKEYLRELQAMPAPTSPAGGMVPCIDSETMQTYLNRNDVKKALHVEPTLDWNICSDINYVEDIPSVIYVYQQFVQAKIPVLIYNGNIDTAVPYTGTQAWIDAQHNWTKTEGLTAWGFNDPTYPYGPQPLGFKAVYNSSLWVVRVNGAGHMVPQFRPAAAFEMFKTFMDWATNSTK